MSARRWGLRQVVGMAGVLGIAAVIAGCGGASAGTDADQDAASADVPVDLPAPQDGLWDLEGDLAVHDPAIAYAEGTWYVYSTGNGQVADGNIQIRTSTDGHTWDYAGEVWQTKPDWLVEAVFGVDNLWAPELVEHQGTWYLYYAASTFGRNTSVIALATNTTLDPDDPDYAWVDAGPVIASATIDDYNAIDPGVAIDADGTPWMSFGSHWSGIRMVELQWPSGLRAEEAEPLLLADRAAPPNMIEAPYLLQHEDYWYLFVSFDRCCRGIESTYNIAVGRAEHPTGPFIDADGVALSDGGGTVLLQTDGARIGPGGQSVAQAGGHQVLAFHYYDGDADGMFTLGLVTLGFDEQGWPALRW